jgi:hypothetical protein
LRSVKVVVKVQVPITREVEITGALKFEDCNFNVTAGKEK